MPDFIFEKVDIVSSTNDKLTEEVNSGILKKDKILVAREQTNGHGTNERSFVSPKNSGIYFTILHFYKDNKELSFITQKVAVAVYSAFKTIFDIELKIKWVNDLYYNDKKVCGVLCRNLIRNKAVLIGIGIDLFENFNFDESLKDIAGYIFKDKKELVKMLKSNKLLSKESCIYKNIYEDFKSMEIPDIDIGDEYLWEPDSLVVNIAERIYSLMKIEGLPKLYIEKNIIKDKKIYEDCNLEC